MKKITPLILVATLIFRGCGMIDNPTVNVSVAKTEKQPSEFYIMAGKIDTDEQATVSSKISAKVAKITVDVGSKVNAGDVIVQLDTTDIRAQVQQAEAATSTAQANLENIMSGSRPELIAQAQASLENAKMNYENVRNNYERTQNLYSDLAVSHQELEAVQTSLSSAEAQYKSAQSQLDIVKQGATKESINVVQKQLVQSQAATQTTKTQLSYGTITAPISGTIAAKNIKIGELAVPGLALVTIVNPDNVCVKAYIPENLVGQLKQGQQVTVKVSELTNKKYEGKISVINPIVNSQSKNILVKVTIKNPDMDLRPGMYTEIALKK